MWLSGNEPDWYPGGRRLDPWPRLVDEGSSLAMSWGVCHRHVSDLALLWLWCIPAATAPIRPLVCEPPYATSAALKRQKTKKIKIIR